MPPAEHAQSDVLQRVHRDQLEALDAGVEASRAAELRVAVENVRSYDQFGGRKTEGNLANPSAVPGGLGERRFHEDIL